ncbi:hypothetical protein AHAS_Ahas12G0162100 [Arachis hypogaea]
MSYFLFPNQSPRKSTQTLSNYVYSSPLYSFILVVTPPKHHPCLVFSSQIILPEKVLQFSLIAFTHPHSFVVIVVLPKYHRLIQYSIFIFCQAVTIFQDFINSHKIKVTQVKINTQLKYDTSKRITYILF